MLATFLSLAKPPPSNLLSAELILELHLLSYVPQPGLYRGHNSMRIPSGSVGTQLYRVISEDLDIQCM